MSALMSCGVECIMIMWILLMELEMKHMDFSIAGSFIKYRGVVIYWLKMVNN